MADMTREQMIEAVKQKRQSALRAEAEKRGLLTQPRINRTSLSPDDENRFQSWYGDIARRTSLDPNPDNPAHKYDYRGAFKAGEEPKLSADDGFYHWPSRFKDADHPNRFVGGIDTKSTDQPILPWSEVPGKALENLVPSLAKNVSNVVTGFPGMVKTAAQFMGNPALGATTVAPQVGAGMIEGMKNRYGSEEALKNTLATDPAGVALDLSTVATGVAGLAGKAPALAKVAGATATALDPLAAGMRIAGKVVPGKIVSGLYGKALRPSTLLTDAQRMDLISTGLNEGITVSHAGLRKTQDKIRLVTDQIDGIINRAGKSGNTVNILDVMKPVEDMKGFWTNSAFPKQFSETIDKAVSDVVDHFATKFPNGNIPIAEAQQIKRNLYQINKNAYEELRGLRVEIQKQMARGIKDEIAKQVPEVAALNARDKKLIAFEDELQKAVGREMNRSVIGMGSGIPAGVAYGMTSNVGTMLEVGAIAKTMASPFIQSKIALFVNSLKKSKHPPWLAPAVTGTRTE